MTDILIRDVPSDVVAAIDRAATALGLSRAEYVRRRLAQDVAFTHVRVTVEDLEHFSATYGDLADPDLMDAAWD